MVKNRSNVQGIRTIGSRQHYFRSLWEIQFAQTLEYWRKKGIIKEWYYEPELFKFPKKNYPSKPYCYLPDFKVIKKSGKVVWYEVKGYMDWYSRKKIIRFRANYPKESLVVISKPWFQSQRKAGMHRKARWEKLHARK